MRGNEFLDKMELIDFAYVEEADIKMASRKKAHAGWLPIAACFCIIAAAAFAVPDLLHSGPQSEPLPDDKPRASQPAQPAAKQPSDTPREGMIINYNKASAFADAARKYIPGYFTEELSKEELASLIPPDAAPNISFSGFAGFDGDGALLDVVLNVDAHLIEGTKITAVFSETAPLNGYVTEEEPKISRLNGHEFKIYEWSPDENSLNYDAFGEIGGVFARINYASRGIPAEQARGDFAMIADLLTAYEDGMPDLSAVKADAVPEYLDCELSLKEAKADAEFGAFMPGSVPAGFAAESIRRFKDQNNDNLSGVWTRSYDELRWTVRRFTEQDAKRLTGTAETGNYDLSLYPIPRADSVPAELREIVNDPVFIAEELTQDAVFARAYKTGESGDSSGWRMRFSVRYGDFIVSISSKGVDPGWLCSSLLELTDY